MMLYHADDLLTRLRRITAFAGTTAKTEYTKLEGKTLSRSVVVPCFECSADL